LRRTRLLPVLNILIIWEKPLIKDGCAVYIKQTMAEYSSLHFSFPVVELFPAVIGGWERTPIEIADIKQEITDGFPSGKVRR
jgi:hypothetical protein